MALPDQFLDRLFTTCWKNDGTDALLVPGSAPLVRLRNSWRALQYPNPVNPQDIETLAATCMGAEPAGVVDGYAYRDVPYRDRAWFRAMAFGYPMTTMLMFARFPSQSAPPAGGRLTYQN